jgi:large subunit ribosomal protein L5
MNKTTNNPMREIKIAQISLNMGISKDEEKLKKALKLLEKISNQAPVQTITKKRIPGWGLRPGLVIGCKVTIRKKKEEMLKRLLTAKENILSKKNFDRQGNFSFGIPEYIDILGMEYDPELKIMGLEAAVTLERPGFRIKKRKICPKKVGEYHRITKEEAIQFIQKKFNTKIE